jgi:hypothetical protein
MQSRSSRPALSGVLCYVIYRALGHGHGSTGVRALPRLTADVSRTPRTDCSAVLIFLVGVGDSARGGG